MQFLFRKGDARTRKERKGSARAGVEDRVAAAVGVPCKAVHTERRSDIDCFPLEKVKRALPA